MVLAVSAVLPPEVEGAVVLGVSEVAQAAREQASMATANRAARMRFFMIHSSFSCFDLAYFRSVRCSYARFSSPCHVIVKWNH